MSEISSRIVKQYGQVPACYYAKFDAALWRDFLDQNVPVPTDPNFYLRAFRSADVDADVLRAILSRTDTRAIGARISREQHTETVRHLMSFVCVDKVVVYINAFHATLLGDMGRAVISGDLKTMSAVLEHRDSLPTLFAQDSDAMHALCVMTDVDAYRSIVYMIGDHLTFESWRQIAGFLIRRTDAQPGGAFYEDMRAAWAKSKSSLRVIVIFLDFAIRMGGHEIMMGAIMNQIEHVGEEGIRHLVGACMYFKVSEQLFDYVYARFYKDSPPETDAALLCRAMTYQTDNAVRCVVRRMGQNLPRYATILESETFANSFLESACKREACRWTAVEWMQWVSFLMRHLGVKHIHAHNLLRVSTHISDMGWTTIDNRESIEDLVQVMEMKCIPDAHDIWMPPAIYEDEDL